MTFSLHPPIAEAGRGAGADRPRSAGTAVCSLVLMASLAVLLLGSGWLIQLPLPLSLLAAGLAGAAATVLWYRYRLVAPLVEMERASRVMEVGDLGVTMPESGPPVLRRLSEAINSLAADFQEVLLLFAHLLRSARGSVRLLQLHAAAEGVCGADRDRAEKIVADIEQMQEMIHDFKYFRVRLDDGNVVDTGVVKIGLRQPATQNDELYRDTGTCAKTWQKSPCPGRGELQ